MKRKKTSPVLVVCLAMIMVVLYLFGFVLRETAFVGNELYTETPVPALPFVYLFDSSYHAQRKAQQYEDGKKNPAETEPAWETEGLETEQELPKETEPAELTKTVYTQGEVSADYFKDVLFIGDSRTDGLYLYSRFDGADYFSARGLTVFTLFEEKGRDGKTMLTELLTEKQYGKIYLMLGINEIGSNMDALVSKYADVVEQLKEAAPEAILVIQANLSIDEKTSSTTWYMKADRIHELNSRIEALADGERVFYLNVNPLFCDENGYLRKEFSGDGVHLYAKYYADWTAWLCRNAFIATEVAVD